MDEFTIDMLEPELTGNQLESGNDPEGTSEGEPQDKGNLPNEGKGDEGGTPPITEKIPYTPEEVATLLASNSKIDTDRLSNEGKLLMREFQRWQSKRSDELEQERSRLEALKQETDPTELLFTKYMADPKKVTADINAEIERFIVIPPADPNYAEAQRTVHKLQALKEEMFGRRQESLLAVQQVATTRASAETEILKSIPDFMEKRDKLTEFCVGSLGLSNDEIMQLSDPLQIGPVAFKLTKIINDLYERENASRTAEGKRKKEPPTVARATADSGIKSEVTAEDVAKMSPAAYRKFRKEHPEL